MPRPAPILAGLALAALAAAPLAARAEELIRVVVAEGQASVVLSGPGLVLRAAGAEGAGDGQGGPDAGRAIAGPAEAVPSGTGVRVGGEAVEGPAVLSASGPIRMGDRILSAVVQLEPGPAGLTVVEELPLDDYVAGVLSGELPRSFPAEAQKAQAVAARTYALVKKIEAEASGRGWHLGANVLSQVYAGADPNPAARAATDATRGEVLVMGNEPVEAFFHAACGGHTESGLEALGRDLPYLASVRCGQCDDAPRVRWTLSLDGAALAKAVGLPGRVSGVRVSERTPSGRAARVEVTAGRRTVGLAAADLRQRLGWSRLPSLALEVAERKGTFTFTGRGQGHGAGLCQWGAAGWARRGEDYREILRRFYPGADVVKMY